MTVITVNKENFNREVLQSDKPVLLDFFADWCGPCRMLGPIVDELAQENPQYKVCKVNVDQEHDLASRFSVMTIPSLFVFKDGQQVTHTVGVKSKEELLELLS